MDVDIGNLRAGADRSYQAADFAAEAAQRLSCGPAPGSAFGAFSAAESFLQALTVAHSNHRQALGEQRDRLGALGDTSHTTASAFAAMDQRNAAALRALR